MQYGALARIDSVKATDDGWSCTGYVSTFGNVDHVGDVVMHGAFDASLAAWKAGAQKIRFLNAHRTDQVLGVATELKADDRGLLGTFKISKTSLGQDIHTLLKDGALDSFSIGYVPTDIEFDDSGVRKLLGVDLLEVSLVSIPANDQAAVTGVKAVWSASYVNDLPDSSFALILPGGTKDDQGKTTPRSLRKLPHHATGGAVDLPHLRNALARAPQMTGVSDSQRSRAVGHLNGHAKSEGVGGKDFPLPLIDEDVSFAELLAQVKGYLMLGTKQAEDHVGAHLSDGELAADHLAAIRELHAEAQASTTRLAALLAAPESGLKLRLEVARARMRRLGVEVSAA
jgi:Escherichia/Staphylococcus phage prohead protease